MALNSISAENLIYSYSSDLSDSCSLSGVTFQIKKGEFIAVLGENGSGKTTLARHFNVLLPLQQGRLTIAGLDAAGKKNLWEIRRSCAMVFQNPDNQFVSSLIEEELAFAPENFGVSEKETQKRIKKVLADVDMSGYEKYSPHMLSGGQKQRIAIAGVLTAEPDILVFDEATAMLDPVGRQEVLSVIRRLHKAGHTIVMITHFAEEAVQADRVILMKNGRITADGIPKQILTDMDLLAFAGIEAPLPVQIYHSLERRGIRLDTCPLTKEELAGELCSLN